MRETPEASAAFHEYAALEERSLENLAKARHAKLEEQARNQEHTKPIPTINTLLSQFKKWSTEHGWQERIKVYDAQLIEKERTKRQKAIDAMNDRHALIGTSQQAKAIKQIEELIAAKKFGSQAVVQLLKLATDLERLARGAPTERTEQTGLNGEPLLQGANVIFYLPKLDEEKGGDADAYSDSSNARTDSD